MKHYKSSGGDSGVVAYEIQESEILVQFQSGPVYRYTYRKPGRRHVEAMKKLALKGKGLTTYINQYIRDNYAGIIA